MTTALIAPADVAAVLNKAADALVEHGWIEGAACANGAMCAGGAIAFIVTGRPFDIYDGEEYPVIEAVCAALADHVDAATVRTAPVDRVVDWNDATPARTADEVIAAIRSAAQHLTSNGVPA